MSDLHAIEKAIWERVSDDPWTGSDPEWADAIRDAMQPALVAAERAGYERCKQDATTAIKAVGTEHRVGGNPMFASEFRRRALAVVAALGQQQEATRGHSMFGEAWHGPERSPDDLGGQRQEAR